MKAQQSSGKYAGGGVGAGPLGVFDNNSNGIAVRAVGGDVCMHATNDMRTESDHLKRVNTEHRILQRPTLPQGELVPARPRQQTAGAEARWNGWL